MKKIDLLSFFRKYRGLSHQIAAIRMLQDEIPDELLQRDSAWVDCFKCDDGTNQPP